MAAARCGACALLVALLAARAAASCTAPPGASRAFIDAATPEAVCSVQLDGGWSGRLVFSDEFSGNSGTAVGSPRDPRWTAVDM